MRRQTAATALLAVGLATTLALAGCAGDPDAFYPGTASGERILEQRALEHVPPKYKPTSVTVVKDWGRRSTATFGAAWAGLPVGSGLGDAQVVGYDAWVRVEGCKGHVLVRFDAWGTHRTTGDLTKCPG